MHALVLQHAACEPPGAYEDVLHERGWSSTRVELDAGDSLPRAGSFDALIVMGGPMSANDDLELPWLLEEKRLIGDSVHARVPVWGVCLGAQLLAASLGASVYGGAEPEVGVCEVALTEAAQSDPVFGGLPSPLPTLQWHGETFDLPPGATLLGASERFPNQAFRVGELAYGLQFHLEASAAMAGEWVTLPAYREALEGALGPDGTERVRLALEEQEGAILAHARAAFGRWLTLADAREAARSTAAS